MGSPSIAASSDLSNIVAIHDAIYSIAVTDSGVTWHGQKQWDFPDTAELLAAGGYPFLAVTWPIPIGMGAGPDGTEEFFDGSMEAWLTWDVDIYCLAPYSAGDPNVFTLPIQAGVQLKQTFTRYNNLNGTCDIARAGNPEPAKLYEMDAQGNRKPGPPLYFSVRLPIRLTEVIETDYTNIA